MINGLSDGTKALNVNAFTGAGTATFNAAVTLGASSSNDIQFLGALASSIPIKTTLTYDIGSATLGLNSIYIGGTSTFTTRIKSAATASHTLTLPPTVGVQGQSLQNSGSGVLVWVPGQTLYSTASGDTTIADNDNIRTLAVTVATTDRTITLPLAANNTNRIIEILKVDGLSTAAAGVLTVDGNGSETIDGATTVKLYSADDMIKIQCTGTGWKILKLRQTEYASNSTTGNADNTTAFIYGEAASLVPQTTLTSARVRRVRFIDAVTRAGAYMQFQIDPEGNSHWTTNAYAQNLNGDQVTPFCRQTAVTYGAGQILTVSGSSTDVDVLFGQYATTSGAYAAAGANWTANFTHKWRLAKYVII